jgi:predicted nucleotidyltransferase
MNLKEVLKILIDKFGKRKIDLVLSGGLALSSLGIHRFTQDIDFLVKIEAADVIHQIMTELGYECQDVSNKEIRSYFSPLKVYGQVDFLLARRKYSRAMIERSEKKPIFDGKLEVKTLLPEDLIGLKVQAFMNDSRRYLIDASDIQRILVSYRGELDMALVREYFKIFGKEDLLDEWLDNIE